MLKGATIKADVKERFKKQYKESYMVWLEGIETDLAIGFGESNIDTFITYARLNIQGMSEGTTELADRIEKKFRADYFESERREWLTKKIY